MKRYVLLATALAALLLVALLLWQQGGSNSSAPTITQPAPQALTSTNSGTPAEVPKDGGPATVDSALTNGITNQNSETEEVARLQREFPDVPVAFYGLVLDQDSNALQGVRIDVEVTQWDTSASPPALPLKTTNIVGETGADGRCEVSAQSGHSVTVKTFTKEGYQPELMRPHYGEYGPQVGSFSEPVVFRMWSTNLHEQLITGDKDFKVVPDGRRYGVDLVKGEIKEGEDGDLVLWIKRAGSAGSPQRYAWSCGLASPGGGGLEPENTPGVPMYRAPTAQYTNAFTFQVDGKAQGWIDKSLDNRFYLKLHNGPYGRLSADFWATYRDFSTYRRDPAFGRIHLSYAINPSGSRVLR